MKRIMALAVAMTFALAHVSSVNAQLQESGSITGTVTGPSAPLAGVSVEVIGTLGSVAGTAVTSRAGTFRIGQLRPGVYTVQALGSNGRIIGASSATLTSDRMTVAVKIDASAGTLADAAVEVPAVGTRRGLSTRMVLAGVGAAAASLGTLLVISTQEDVSGSR